MAFGKIGQIKSALVSGAKKKETKTETERPSSSKREIQTTRQRDKNSSVTGSGVELLDRDPKNTKSDAGASSEVVTHQRDTAAAVLGSGQSESEFDKLNNKEAKLLKSPVGGSLIDRVAVGDEHPSALNVRGLVPPTEFTPGSPEPTFPDLSNEVPKSVTEKNNERKEVFELDGEEYTKTTDVRGNTRLSYEKDGQQFYESHYTGGQTVVGMTEDTDDFRYDRTLRYDKDGKLVSDGVSSQNKPKKGDPKEFYSETVTADGTRTTEQNKKVYDDETGEYRRDSSTVNTEKSDGRTVKEHTLYDADGGYTNRETTRGKDGKIESVRSEISDSDGNVQVQTLDLTPPLDPVKFSEQTSEFAKNGDPKLLEQAILDLDDEQLHDVALSLLSFDLNEKDADKNLIDFIAAMSDVSEVGGEKVTSKLAAVVHDAIIDESFDFDSAEQHFPYVGEAFKQHIAEGGDGTLGMELIDRLLETTQSGKPEAELAHMVLRVDAGESIGLVNGVTQGLVDSAARFDKVSTKVNELNGELAVLIEQASHFIGEGEEIEKACAAFVEAHQDIYDEYNDLGGKMFTQNENLLRLGELEQMCQERGMEEYFESSSGRLDNLNKGLTERFDQALSSENGRSRMASELEKMSQGDSSFTRVFEMVINDPDITDEQKNSIYDKIYVGAAASAGEAIIQDDQARADRIFDGLAVADPSLGSEELSLLKDISSGEADLEDPEIKTRIKKTDMSEKRLERVFGPTAAVIGYANKSRGDGLFDAKTAVQYFEDIREAVGLSSTSAELLGVELPKILSGSMATKAIKMSGRLDVVLGSASAIESFVNGDYAEGGFNVASAIGTTLMLSSSNLVAGTGLALYLGAEIGKGIYHWLQPDEINQNAVNFFKNVFDGSGLDDEQVKGMLVELQKTDFNGELIWERLGKTAKELGLDPREFLYTIAKLDAKDRDRLLDRARDARPNSKEFTESDSWRLKQQIVDLHADEFGLRHLEQESVTGASLEERFDGTIFPNDRNILLAPPDNWDGLMPGHWVDLYDGPLGLDYADNINAPWLD